MGAEFYRVSQRVSVTRSVKVSRVTADRPGNSVDCLSNPLLLLPSLVKKEEKQQKKRGAGGGGEKAKRRTFSR